MNVKNKIIIKKKNKPMKFLIMSIFVSLFSVSITNAADLKDIKYAKLPGNIVQINLDTQGAFDEPSVFNTSDPARLAFDFFGMTKGDVENLIKIGIGSVDSIVTVATEDRTRVVVNLVENANFDTEMLSDGFVITVGKGVKKTSQAAAVRPKPFAKQPELATSKYIEKIDFRRSKNGGGKIIVNLSDPSTSIDVSEQAGEIVVDFQNTNLDSGLEKRLDVTDFATPIDSVDSFQSGENVRLIMVPNAKYRQISYQNGTEFTVIVDPFVETEEERAAREQDGTGFNGERLSINFQRIQVRAALAVIADFTGINIVASDDVEGELTLNLKDVPWDQALDVILETKGLAKRQTGDVIWVAPAAKVAELKKAQAEAARASAELEPLVSEVIQVNYAKAEELRKVILGEVESGSAGNNANSQDTFVLLGGDGESSNFQNPQDGKSSLKITADPRSNSLIITTTVKNLASIKQLIAKLDKALQQVMVETRIVEASDTFSRELGAKLGFQRVTENTRIPGPAARNTNFGTTISGATLAGNQTIDRSLVDENPLNYFNEGPGLNVDLGANPIGLERAASYAFQLFKAGKGYANILSLELSALEANGNGKIVASPRLVAANNTEASIKQGQIKIFSRDNSDGDVLEREAVLELKVKPQITPDDKVILTVNITQDFFEGLDIINTKEINTQVLIENGETIIIGGIYQEQDSHGVSKVPLLGDIPVLGNLFKKKSKTKNRTELLIFLTPKLINDALRLG